MCVKLNSLFNREIKVYYVTKWMRQGINIKKNCSDSWLYLYQRLTFEIFTSKLESQPLTKGVRLISSLKCACKFNVCDVSGWVKQYPFSVLIECPSTYISTTWISSYAVLRCIWISQTWSRNCWPTRRWFIFTVYKTKILYIVKTRIIDYSVKRWSGKW